MSSNNQAGWPRIGRWALGGILMAAATLAHGQYVWIDDKGLKQYSDRPPAPTVPARRILKAPGLTAADATPAPQPAASATSAPLTTAEREADFRKRKAEQEAGARKAEDEARRQAELDSNCAQQRKNQQMLESGMRIGTINAQGERDFLSDAQRAEQARKIQRALAGCK